LIPYLKELWSRRRLVGAVVGGAALLSVIAIYNVGLFPPSISQREQVNAEGRIEILVDSAHSPIADARRDLSGLSARAIVFARLIAGGNIVRQMAKRADIPFKQIDVTGPAPPAGTSPPVEPVLLHPYGISITSAEELPILVVSTRAPTVDEAKRLAAAAPPAVRQEVEGIQQRQDTAPGRRVEFRVLGPAEAGTRDAALGKKAALGLFVALVAIGLVLILGIPRFRAAWREEEEAVHLTDQPRVRPDEPKHEPDATPAVVPEPDPSSDVVQLLSDRGGEPEEAETEATSAGAESS
jgi:hypothetical protein